MAKPRVFISSTFYDLLHVREDLERFIKELGYESVRHETGSIPYQKEGALEKSAYREVDLCDIMVCIIGNRFGTESKDDPNYSITQKEIQRAIEKGIQVFIFVESNVYSEYYTYKLNKETKEVKYRFVDDIRIYKFLEQLYALQNNNPITKFETTFDIIEYLRVQWAGLFQSFLQQQQRLSELKILDEMKSVASTLQQLVQFLTDEENRGRDEAVKNILMPNHPAFIRFAKLTGTDYRVFFTNKDELSKWIKRRGFDPIKQDAMDRDSIYEWINEKEKKYIKITEDIFDEKGRLKIYTEYDWKNDWVTSHKTEPDEEPPKDEEIPF